MIMTIKRAGIGMALLLSTTLAVSLAATVSPAWGSPPDPPEDTTATVVHLNLGGNGYNGGSTGKPIDDLVDHIEAEQGDLISLNEVCLTQWLATEDRLKSRDGYEDVYTQYAVTNVDVPNCADPEVDPGGHYVMGVMARGEGTPVMFGDDPYLALGYDYVATSIARHRKLVCADVDLPAREVRFCNTHLELADIRVTPETTGDPDIVNDRFFGATMNEAQATVIAETIDPWLRRHAVILAGDFNTEPWHPTLDSYYQRCGDGGLTEVDSHNPENRGDVESFPAGGWWPAITAACPDRNGQPTVHLGTPREPCENFGDLCQDWKPGDVVPFTGERKIDYIFVNPKYVHVAPDSARTEYTDYADHVYLYGEVTLH